MNKLKNFVIIAVGLTALNLVGCGRSGDNDDDDPIPTPPVVNQLCNGKTGNTTFFPLANGNKWVYDYNYSASYSERDTLTVSGTTVIAGKTYFNVHRFIAPTPMMSSADYKIRVDATTKDVYFYNASTSSEIMLIPGNPTVNQTLGQDMYLGSLCPTRKIVSINENLVTSYCNYTGCVKIEKRSQSNTLIGYDYYKKGLGFIYSSDFKLKKVVLN